MKIKEIIEGKHREGKKVMKIKEIIKKCNKQNRTELTIRDWEKGSKDIHTPKSALKDWYLMLPKKERETFKESKTTLQDIHEAENENEIYAVKKEGKTLHYVWTDKDNNIALIQNGNGAIII